MALQEIWQNLKGRIQEASARADCRALQSVWYGTEPALRCAEPHTGHTQHSNEHQYYDIPKNFKRRFPQKLCFISAFEINL
jgi:hypothetical protein